MDEGLFNRPLKSNLLLCRETTDQEEPDAPQVTVGAFCLFHQRGQSVQIPWKIGELPDMAPVRDVLEYKPLHGEAI
jgi:hypothetical protein